MMREAIESFIGVPKKTILSLSNLKRLEDGLMEKIILEYLEQFAKVKEVEVQTKDLRGKENEY